MAKGRYSKAWLECLGVSEVICQAMAIPTGDDQAIVHLKKMTKDDLAGLLESAQLSGLLSVIWSGIEKLQSDDSARSRCSSACNFHAGQVSSPGMKCSACGDEKKCGRKMNFCTSCCNAVCASCMPDTEEPVAPTKSRFGFEPPVMRSRTRVAPGGGPMDGLEDEVAEWIEALTNDKRGNRSFLEWLKDGKVLCRMANVIKPGSVPRVNENCTTPWKERENVSAFIRATRTMGLMEKDTFSTPDLQEGKEWRVVNSSLLQLGALSRNVPGFNGPYIGIANQAKVRDGARVKQKTTQYGGLRTDVNEQLRDNFTNVNHM